MDITEKQWHLKKGVELLKKAGVKSGSKILEFGSGSGRYTIPLGIAAGKEGFVYAVDTDKEKRKIIKEKIKEYNVSNVKIIDNKWSIKFDYKESSFDCVVFYDILHSFDLKKRKSIYGKTLKILKDDGIMTLFPKHTIKDFPACYYAGMEVEEVIDEALEAGFVLYRKITALLSHDEEYIKGTLYTFKKA